MLNQGVSYMLFPNLFWEAFMKKAIFMVSTLLLAMMMVVGCDHGNNDSNNPKPKEEALKLNEKQQAIYDSYIDTAFNAVAQTELAAEAVKAELANRNETLKKDNAGFMIKDTQEGQPIKAGTSKEDLKKRFIPVKA